MREKAGIWGRKGAVLRLPPNLLLAAQSRRGRMIALILKSGKVADMAGLELSDLVVLPKRKRAEPRYAVNNPWA